jgi:hypothetical protein
MTQFRFREIKMGVERLHHDVSVTCVKRFCSLSIINVSAFCAFIRFRCLFVGWRLIDPVNVADHDAPISKSNACRQDDTGIIERKRHNGSVAFVLLVAFLHNLSVQDITAQPSSIRCLL